MDRKANVRGVFDRAAKGYGEKGAGFFNNFGKRLVEIANLKPSDKVLDVACGKGASLIPASEKTKDIIGIDLSSEMVRELKAKGPWNVKVMDAEALEFPSDTFDVILCGFALFFFPEKEKALKEFRRVLKKDGKLVLCIWGDDSDLDNWLKEESALIGKKHLASHLDKNDLEMVLAKFFQDVSILDETSYYEYESKEEWWESLWTHATRGTLESMNEKQLLEAQERGFKKINDVGLKEPFHVFYATASGKPTVDS